MAVAGLVLAGCGGGDDDDDDASASSTSSTVVAAATSTTAAPTTTAPPTTATPTTVAYVTEGATVVVANASGINGAAGRLSERLAAVGFDMAEATNSADTVSNLEVTQIYYDPAVEGALPVAESLKAAFGGGDIEVLEVSVPAPTESGELGAANVLVLMGNDIADKTLEELQGVAPAPTTTEAGSDEETGEESGEESGEETTTTTADDSTEG